MASEDTLLTLQNAIKSNYAIKYATSSGDEVASLQEASHLRLSPSVLLPKTAPTRFRKPSASATGPKATPTDFLNLDALLVAWLGRDATVVEYMKLVRELGSGAAFVSVTERNGVVEWLEGKVAHHDRVVSLAGELGVYHYLLIVELF